MFILSGTQRSVESILCICSICFMEEYKLFLCIQFVWIHMFITELRIPLHRHHASPGISSPL